MMRHFALLAAAELAFAAVAPAADYAVTNNTPPGYTVVNKSPACSYCGEQCKCKPGVCPGSCPVQAPAPREKGLPAGYPAAPDGYEWRRDDRGPDGWGLFQVGTAASVTSPQRATPAQQYGWRQVCTGNGCRLVYGPLP